MQEPVHPILPLQDAFKTLLIILIALGSVQFLLGHWDKFIIHVVEWFPLWHWGG